MGWTRFFRRERWDQERERELQTYLAIETEENIARGMTPEEARHAARRKLGNPTQIREEIYRMNSLAFIESLWQDVRCGLRMLRKNAGFAVVAILTLALGIGANTAIFSVIHAVLLSPLPYNDPDRIFLLLESNPSRGFPQFSVSPPNYFDWKKDSTSFEQITSIARGDFNYTGGAEPERLSGARVGPSFFAVMGVMPAIGRAFLPEDDVQGKASVVVTEPWFVDKALRRRSTGCWKISNARWPIVSGYWCDAERFPVSARSGFVVALGVRRRRPQPRRQRRALFAGDG